MSKSINIRFPSELENAINELRGDVTFSAWVKRAVIQRIERESSADTSTLETKQGRPVVDKNPDNGKRTTREERIELIRDCYNRGLDYKQTSFWLNEKGYLSERGSFTPNSVRAIAKRSGIS